MWKLLSFTALAILFVASPAQAQSEQDSLKADTSSRRASRAFVDEDGDGIHDRGDGKGQRHQYRKDRFVDLDGDGICDSRASGLGFRRGQGKAMQPGEVKPQGPRRGGR
jgi:hypothetical protein